MIGQPSDGEIREALRAYFRVLQSDPTAEELLRTVVTEDFETGFADGYRWKGPSGLRMFLALCQRGQRIVEGAQLRAHSGWRRGQAIGVDPDGVIDVLCAASAFP